MQTGHSSQDDVICPHCGYGEVITYHEFSEVRYKKRVCGSCNKAYEYLTDLSIRVHSRLNCEIEGLDHDFPVPTEETIRMSCKRCNLVKVIDRGR